VVENVDLPTALADLKKRGFRIFALSADGKGDLKSVEWGDKNVMVLGGEAQGVSKPVRAEADVLAKIARTGHAESLNVGVACGIALYEYQNKT
jgi:tRNA G18 (ribose-2'-O)-methylase SpoU